MLTNHFLVVAVHYRQAYQVVFVAMAGHQIVYRATIPPDAFLKFKKENKKVNKLSSILC